jgi:hypothetical protein
MEHLLWHLEFHKPKQGSANAGEFSSKVLIKRKSNGFELRSGFNLWHVSSAHPGLFRHPGFTLFSLPNLYHLHKSQRDHAAHAGDEASC